MRWAKVISFVLSSVVVLWGSTANADLTNGGFETGLADWSFTGTVQAVEWEDPRDTLLYGLQPPFTPHPHPLYAGETAWRSEEGDSFASLWSTDSAGTNESTLSRTFTTPTPGYVLSFDYFFDYGDFYPNCDKARIWVKHGGSLLPLFEVLINYGCELGDDENIDWTPVLVPLHEAGDYTLGFKITDIDGGTGYGFESILGVDNVNVVPLPPALLLGGLGLGFAGGLLGRFHGRRTS